MQLLSFIIDIHVSPRVPVEKIKYRLIYIIWPVHQWPLWNILFELRFLLHFRRINSQQRIQYVIKRLLKCLTCDVINIISTNTRYLLTFIIQYFLFADRGSTVVLSYQLGHWIVHRNLPTGKSMEKRSCDKISRSWKAFLIMFYFIWLTTVTKSLARVWCV